MESRVGRLLESMEWKVLNNEEIYTRTFVQSWRSQPFEMQTTWLGDSPTLVAPSGSRIGAYPRSAPVPDTSAGRGGV